jgi:hypothetical protein
MKKTKGRCSISDADTHVDVLSQQLVRGLVLLDRVVVDTAAGEGAAEEEAEEPVNKTKVTSSVSVRLYPIKYIPSCLCSSLARGGSKKKLGKERLVKTYPPLRAPTGLRAGSGAAATASRRGAELVNVRIGAVFVARARAPCDSILEAMATVLMLRSRRTCRGGRKKTGRGKVAEIAPIINQRV